MDIDPALVSRIDLAGSLDREIDKPARMMPPSLAMRAVASRRPKAVTWIENVISSRFMPSPEETVVVSKANHGVRPVALWDVPTRVLYGALAAQLDPVIPAPPRGRQHWDAFKRAPLDHPGAYVVATDIAACYHYIDHNLLMEELLVQTGDHAVINNLGDVLVAAQGRTYSLPQQSSASDLLAEALLDRLERVLIRRGVQAFRYNDDFRFICRSWSDAVRAIEIFAEETRRVGLTMNDLKTVTWKRSTYQRSLEEAEELRKQIADEARYDLTLFSDDPYGDEVDVEPEPSDVDREAAARIVARWARVGARSSVGPRRAKEHRALLDLLPSTLRTLETDPALNQDLLGHVIQILRFARHLTPAACRYLASRTDSTPAVTVFSRLLRSGAYLNGWQAWWLQHVLAAHNEFGTGDDAARRIRWLQDILKAETQPLTVRAHAALSLARHAHISAQDLLSMYDRTPTAARPPLVAAIALVKPPGNIRKAVTQDNQLHRWVYEWAPNHA
ncbi:RNA-directed DNA polymerase [Dactylosporangium sp. NPDC051485]|uniref:RNA-directed DNA polymerase n=1 Tax=Dactylosporangium sp. NPDC051485 TaxID=3154846 RepID=UPI003433A4B4